MSLACVCLDARPLGNFACLYLWLLDYYVWLCVSVCVHVGWSRYEKPSCGCDGRTFPIAEHRVIEAAIAITCLPLPLPLLLLYLSFLSDYISFDRDIYCPYSVAGVFSHFLQVHQNNLPFSQTIERCLIWRLRRRDFVNSHFAFIYFHSYAKRICWYIFR